MRKRKWYVLAATLVVGSSLVVAGFATASRSNAEQALTKVTLQSKWVVQSQFAGYYVAKAKGYYKQAGLDVNIKAGGPDILPEQVVLGKQAEFGINWFPSTLQQRDTGNDLVNIGAGLREERHDGGHVQVERDQHLQEDARQEVRRVDLRERVRAARGARQERDGPGQGRPARQAELRHARVPERRDRRRRRR